MYVCEFVCVSVCLFSLTGGDLFDHLRSTVAAVNDVPRPQGQVLAGLCAEKVGLDAQPSARARGKRQLQTLLRGALVWA